MTFRIFVLFCLIAGAIRKQRSSFPKGVTKMKISRSKQIVAGDVKSTNFRRKLIIAESRSCCGLKRRRRRRSSSPLLSSCGRPFTISSHCQLHPLNNEEDRHKLPLFLGWFEASLDYHHHHQGGTINPVSYFALFTFLNCTKVLLGGLIFKLRIKPGNGGHICHAHFLPLPCCKISILTSEFFNCGSVYNFAAAAASLQETWSSSQQAVVPFSVYGSITAPMTGCGHHEKTKIIRSENCLQLAPRMAWRSSWCSHQTLKLLTKAKNLRSSKKSWPAKPRRENNWGSSGRSKEESRS